MGGLISLSPLFAQLPSGPGLLNSLPTYAPYRWVAVRKRFKAFHRNLALTQTQREDALTKRAGVVNCLNRAYYNTNSDIDHSFLIGSWAKGTAIRPPRDVDMYFLIPSEVYHRFKNYLWSRQSALLQEVKEKLATTYPTTEIRGDGQVVVVKFDTYNVEVVPAFQLATPGRYWICDTKNGGSYKETAPWDEVSRIEAIDLANGQNLRPLIRMLKTWQAYCSVPIKSFQLELVASEFIAQSPWRLYDWFYFDWIIRDFFAFLYHRANYTFFAPGTREPIPLGDEWQSRVLSAHARAVKACDYERDNYIALAGDEWQKIFGNDIPLVL